MKALCTGSSGLLGTALCEKLEQLGHSVYRMSHEAMEFEQIWDVKTKLGEIEYIYHCGAYGNHSYQKDLDQMMASNIGMTVQLLERTKNIPYKAFINVGSSSEYGRKGLCMREDMVLNPDTFYAATKAAGTHLARAFAKQYDKPIITVRPFSIYGQGEAEHRFIPTVIRKLKSQEPIEVCEGEHDWIHVEDIVEAMIRLLPHADKYKGEVFNIGTGETYTNGFVVDALRKIIDTGSIIKHVDQLRPWDSGVWCADITKLKSVIGYDWKPRHIITGLKELVNEQQTKDTTDK